MQTHSSVIRSSAISYLLVGFLLVGATTGSARGDLVWAQAVPNSPGASVISQGPIQTLSLGCNPLPGQQCLWDITIMMDSEGHRAYSWALDVETRAQDTGRIAVQGSFFFPPSAINEGTHAPNVLNGANGKMIKGPYGYSLDGPTGTFELAQFTLAMNQSPGGESSTLPIYAGVGQFEFGGDGPNGYNTVRIGPNARRVGDWRFNPGTGDTLLEPLPFIQIQNIPEPATIALLGLASSFMVARRKLKRRCS